MIPATSAATERAFSVAGLICSDRRNRREENMFELLVVAKSNKDLLWSRLYCIAYYWCVCDGTVQ